MEAHRQQQEALRAKVELFEQIPEVAVEIRKKQLHFSYKLEQYVKKSGRSCFSANWLNGAWWAWSARQAEIAELTQKAQMCRDEKKHAINRWTAIRGQLTGVESALSEMSEIARGLERQWYVLHEKDSLHQAKGIDQCVNVVRDALKKEECRE